MDPHLDAERLAAFMEGSISRGERAQIEQHAAGCADCMQQLAAMARTAEVGAARASALPRFMRWAVPAAVAATALAVWINVDQGPREHSAPRAGEPVAPPAVQQKDAPARDATTDTRTDPAVQPSPAESKPAPSLFGSTQDRARRTEKAAAPGAPAAVPELPAEIASAAAANRDASAPAAAPAAAAAPPLPAPLQAPQPLAETVQTERRESLARSMADSGVQLEIRSPDPARRWRVRGRLLERSLDAGRTWQLQEPALTVDVLAGSAPSAEVAWLVGRAGAVLRTIDGQQWARLPFPDRADLTAVQAVTPLDAAVTTADGRRFRTTDGGLTWVLQESPGPPF